MNISQLRIQLAKNIREYRLHKSLTQEDMAKFRFNIRHYQDIEGGKININLETILRLAQAFKIEPRDLFDFK